MSHPQSAVLVSPGSSIVEFSVDGVAETQVPPGRYTFFTSLPVEGKGNLFSITSNNREEWPHHDAVEGGRLEIAARMKLPAEPAKGVLISTGPVSDEAKKAEGDKQPENEAP